MIKKYSKFSGKYFWIGLRDIDLRGEYGWVSVSGVKRIVIFFNWNFFEFGECISR